MTEVLVTQADREAAAAYVRETCSEAMRVLGAGSGIIAGEIDDHPAVQAFARHRIAGQAELQELLREQHEAMADVMMLRRPSSGPAQREKAEAAIGVWRKVDAYLSHPLAQMVALDEQLEAENPGWMTGELSTAAHSSQGRGNRG